MSIFDILIPRWAVWAAIAAVLFALTGYHLHQVSSARKAGAAEVQAKWDEDKRYRSDLAATAAENERVKGSIHARELAEERAQRAADVAVADAAAAGARRELQRLRSTGTGVTARLVQALQDPASRPGADALAIASGDVLDQCAGEVFDLGQQAEDLATRLRGLQAWARSAVKLCGPPEPETPADREVHEPS